MINGNLAYNTCSTYGNAIFNVALYEAKYGAIETVEYPEKVWLHDIREKNQRKMIELKTEQQEQKRRRICKQKRLGVFSLLMAAMSIIAGFWGIEELYTVSIPFIIGGIGLITTHKIIV